MTISPSSFLVKAHQHRHQLIKCSVSDHFAFRSPVSVVFLYRKQIPLDLVVNALKTTLNDFPIFAGVLLKRSGDLYIDCNNQGVQVTTIQVNESLFPSVCNLENLDSTKFVEEIHPHKDLKHRKPILIIKLSYYNDGMAIGYCWHHSIGDMGTFMQFLKALSASAQQKPYAPPLIPNNRTDYLENWLEEKRILTGKKEQHCKLKYLSFLDLFRFVKQLCSPKQTAYLYFTENEIVRLRDEISKNAKEKLSRNDVLCAYLLDFVTRCRDDQKGIFHLSLIVNMRSRLGMPPNILGNYVDMVSLKTDNPRTVGCFASEINRAVKGYLDEHFQHYETKDFMRRNGGIKKIGRILPRAMLPQYKNLTITNWSNFDVYSIDFGVTIPHLFLPIGRTPLPWVSCIVEGFDNTGLLVTLALPPKVAKRLTSPEILEQIHQYCH